MQSIDHSSARPGTAFVIASILTSLAAAFVIPACSGDDRQIDTQIFAVAGDRDGTELRLGINSCNATEIHVRVTEEADTVDLLVQTVGGHEGDECADATKVVLDEPLADRLVVDETTGDVITVGPLED